MGAKNWKLNGNDLENGIFQLQQKHGLPRPIALFFASRGIGDETVEDFRRYVEDKGYKFFPIMAAINYQTEPLLKEIQEQLSKLPPIVKYEREEAPVIAEEDITRQEVKVTKQDGIFVVECDWLLRVLRTINFDDSESLQYFQRVLINSGVIDALKQAGVNEGDTVSIYDIEFDFVE